MITRDQVLRLIERPPSERQILSAFLDMSVNSDNKRTHQVFINKEKASHQELDSDRDGKHREALGGAFARLDRWLESTFDETNKGAAVYIEVGGDWMEAFQFPLPVENRLVLDDRPVVSPLAQIVERYHHHGVILVDRERLRLLSLYLDQTLHEEEVRTDPVPAPHDIKRGGFSARDYQSRKAEETRHFFREFATEVEDFARRFEPDDLMVLGTHENVKQFIPYLTSPLQALVVHTDRIEIDATPAEITRKLAPIFRARLEREEAEAVNLLRDRVREAHLAVAGIDRTLEQLQEGKIATLVLSRSFTREGGRCTTCSFLLPSAEGPCPYCGGEVRDGIDLSEELIRIAGDQSVHIDFVGPGAVQDLGGVGAILRF